jgi:hypothetical protein
VNGSSVVTARTYLGHEIEQHVEYDGERQCDQQRVVAYHPHSMTCHAVLVSCER